MKPLSIHSRIYSQYTNCTVSTGCIMAQLLFFFLCSDTYNSRDRDSIMHEGVTGGHRNVAILKCTSINQHKIVSRYYPTWQRLLSPHTLCIFFGTRVFLGIPIYIFKKTWTVQSLDVINYSIFELYRALTMAASNCASVHAVSLARW